VFFGSPPSIATVSDQSPPFPFLFLAFVWPMAEERRLVEEEGS
jgi:hypothetical protein